MGESASPRTGTPFQPSRRRPELVAVSTPARKTERASLQTCQAAGDDRRKQSPTRRRAALTIAPTLSVFTVSAVSPCKLHDHDCEDAMACSEISTDDGSSVTLGSADESHSSLDLGSRLAALPVDELRIVLAGLSCEQLREALAPK